MRKPWQTRLVETGDYQIDEITYAKKRGYSTSSYKARKEGEVAKLIIRWCVRTKRMAPDWEGLRTTLYFFVFLYFVFINFVASILLFIQILMGKFYARSACSMQKQIDL